LRIRFNSVYKEGLIEIPNSNTKNDELFFYILRQVSPYSKLGVHNAVYILMAYYFEYCDIYETPELTNIGLFK
jgi:hypothetical protein